MSESELDAPSRPEGPHPRLGRWPATKGGVRSESVRAANLATVLRHLHLTGPCTRSQLVEHTGLTRTSVGALVGELALAELVTEHAALSDGTPGRPSPLVAVNRDDIAVLAIEIAVDSVAVAVVGLGGEVLTEMRIDRPRERVTVAETVADLTVLVGQTRAAASVRRLLGVGVAVAGIVRRATNTVVLAPNLGWDDVPLGDLIAEACDLDVPVHVGNEGDLGALAEIRRGAAVGQRDVIYLSGEVGVGGGIVANGRPVIGRRGFAGEIGHLPVNPSGRRCGCGSRGCWETEVSETALLRRTGRPVDGGQHAISELLSAAAAGDRDSLRALERQGYWLGVGLAGLVNVFDPDIVVLGGMFRRVHGHVIDALRASLATRVVAAADGIAIVPSALGSDVALLGAAELAFDPLLTDPLAAQPR